MTLTLLAAAVMQLIPLILSLSVHEYAHAYCARRLGDRTAERAGRLTLNPAVHVDPIGTVALPLGLLMLAGGTGMTGLPFFGWAKPTPVDLGATTRRLRVRTAGMLISAAGPLSNLAVACACALALRGLLGYAVGGSPALVGLATFAVQMTYLNVGLAIFNLLPVGALDGHAVLLGLLPPQTARQVEAWNAQYGTWVLVGIVLFGRQLLGVPIRHVAGTLLTVVGAG